jgi:nucleotide-binding universal stress UspA family protein
MQAMGPILFPVDFSPRCRAVVPLVKATAVRLGSKVTLFYAIQIPDSLFTTERPHSIMIDTEATLSNAREELLRFYAAPAETVDATAEIGDPALKIVEYAGNHGIGLIMIPTHGYGTFRSLLLGSVAAKVLHDAACPVWTAAHTEGTELPAQTGYKSILCALDLQDGSTGLLRHAVDFASRFGATLRVVHAIADPLPGPDALSGTNFHEFLMEAAREEIANIQSKAGTAVDVCLGAMPVADWVREVARHHAADLVVIGRGHIQGNFGRLRTSAYSIIREAPCPVLSF